MRQFFVFPIKPENPVYIKSERRKREMQLIRSEYKPNSLTDTLALNRAVLATQEADSIEEVENTYRNLINALCSCRTLYVLADQNSVSKKTGLPLVATEENVTPKKSIYVFSSLAYCRMYAVSKNFRPLFLEIPKDTEHDGTFMSLFQIALLKGITHVMVNAGFVETELLTEEIIKYGNLGYQASQTMTGKELDELVKKGTINPKFNRAVIAKKDTAPAVYHYRTTYPMSYNKILHMVNCVLSSFEFYTIERSTIAGGKKEKAADQNTMEGKSVFDVLKEECNVITITGFNRITDAVIRLEFYNQTNRVSLSVYEEYPDHYAPDYREDRDRFTNFMNSMEMNGYAGTAVQQSLELYQRYVCHKLGAELAEEDQEKIDAGFFQYHNFAPEIHVPGEEEVICPLCYRKYIVDLAKARDGEDYECKCPYCGIRTVRVKNSRLAED